MFSVNPRPIRIGFRETLNRSSPATSSSIPHHRFTSPLQFIGSRIREHGCRTRSRLVSIKSMDELIGSRIQEHGCRTRSRLVSIKSMDEDSMDFSPFDEWDTSNEIFGSMSEDEESDIEVPVNPSGDVDMPSNRDRFENPDAALTVTAHRLVTLQKGRGMGRIQPGVIINIGLITFLVILLVLVDSCSWRVVRLPFAHFYLTRPFSISAFLASCAGYLYVPLLDYLKIHQILRKEGPVMHSSKKGIPTIGGLFFIPIGIAVARFIAGFSSIEVYGAAAAALAFAAIGLLDDILSLANNHNYGLPACIKFLLLAAVGTWFSFWANAANISSPYSMKMLIPLPAPLGLVYLGKFYLLLSAFCFVAMGNGINLTDGLDGLAGGTAALAFIGMSIAVLPICPDLAIFGTSMAGACIGFLVHNRYKASVFMGDTGSLALGGALAAMASCTGMFFPLFISSGVFVLEVLSVMMQVMFFKATKRLYGSGRRLFRMAPFHHHLELCGLKEPLIVASTYAVSCIMAVFAEIRDRKRMEGGVSFLEGRPLGAA